MAEHETMEEWRDREKREQVENPILAHIKQLRGFAELARAQAESYDRSATLMQAQYDLLVRPLDTP